METRLVTGLLKVGAVIGLIGTFVVAFNSTMREVEIANLDTIYRNDGDWTVHTFDLAHIWLPNFFVPMGIALAMGIFTWALAVLVQNSARYPDVQDSTSGWQLQNPQLLRDVSPRVIEEREEKEPLWKRG